MAAAAPARRFRARTSPTREPSRSVSRLTSVDRMRRMPQLCRKATAESARRTLIARQLEIAFGGALRPGTGERAVVGAEVGELAVEDVADRRAGLGLVRPLGLDVNRPVARVERRHLERDRIGPRIARAGDCLAVEAHDHGDVVARLPRHTPVAVPCADERIAFLRVDDRRRECHEHPRDADDAALHGTTLRLRATDSSAPTILSGERLVSLHIYSQSSL